MKQFPASRVPAATPLPVGWKLGLVAAVLALIFLLLIVQPPSYTDSFDYAKHMVAHHSGAVTAGQDRFFDFGHVLWRPAGLLFWGPFQGVLRPKFHGDDILAAGSVLIGISIFAASIGAVVLFLWMARLTGRAAVALFATVAYLGSNAALYYTATGMAYITGITFQILSLWLIDNALSRGGFRFPQGLAAGIVLGLSIAVWFPYVLAAGGVFAYALLWEPDGVPQAWKDRAGGLMGLVAGTVCLAGLVYAIVILAAGFRTFPEIALWVSSSRYNKLPDRGLLRMFGTGIPRAFYALGDANVIWKQLVFERRIPSPAMLWRSGIWKVAIVYGALGAVSYTLWRIRGGRPLLASLLAIAVPLGIFAAFLFEATPPERYLAALPLLFAAFAYALAAPQAKLVPKILIAALFVSMLAVNVTAMSRFRDDTEFAADRVRLRPLNDQLRSGDKVFLLSPQDGILKLVYAHPFDDLARNRYCYEWALPWGERDKELWRTRFAGMALNTWAGGGHVWISNRLLADSPQREWGWVEGDLAGISWTEIPAFFRKFEMSRVVGNTGGFSEIARSASNLSILDPLAPIAKP